MRGMTSKRALWTALGLVLAAGVAMAAQPSDPVALLVKFQGDVAVERPGAGERLAGAVGLHLQAGDELFVAEGGQAVVLYRTGRLVRAAAPITIESVEETGASSLFTNTVRTLGQVATTDARTQPNRQGMIRPIAGAPAPIAPRNRIKVLSVRPTFTWFSASPGSGYVLQLQRQGSNAPRPVRYQVGMDTTWTLPDTEAPLLPGASYTWTVGGDGAGRVAQTQHFAVASADDIAALQAALDELVEAGIEPADEGLFLAALAYRDGGFHYEAARAIRRIEEQGNGSGRAFFMLKGEVLDALGDVEAAEEAFRAAAAVPGA